MDDRYGRFRELSLELAARGHDVRGVCLSYSTRPEESVVDARGAGRVEWSSVNLGASRLRGVLSHQALLRQTGREVAPDVVWAVSDAYHVIQGVRLARSIGAVSAVDLYDNFESYTGMWIPGTRRAFRRAVTVADVVTCVSEPLSSLVQGYGRTRRTEILPNGVPTGLFGRGNRTAARENLGLSPESPIVGVVGALLRHRDIATVFRAVDRLAAEDPRVTLLVAGERDRGIEWPQIAAVVDLGVIGHPDVPDVIRACDVMVVPNRDSSFGRYCFPQKAVESMAAGVPMVAADTPVMRDLMGDTRDGLYEVGNASDLARALRLRIEDRRTTQGAVSTWYELAGDLEGLMFKAMG